MEFEKSRVYIVTDDQGRIIQIEGEYSLDRIKDFDKAILIEEGAPCDRLNHAQTAYFPGPIFTGDGIPRYRWDGTAATERSEDEIAADRAQIAIEPTTEEVLLELAADHEARICEIELGVN